MVCLIAFATVLAYSVSGNRSLFDDIPFFSTFFQNTNSNVQTVEANGGTENEVGDIVINYNSTEHPSFELYNNILYKCTKDFLTAFDESGYQMWHLPLNFKSYNFV